MIDIAIQNEYGSATFSPLAGASLRSLTVNTEAGRSFELLTGGDGPHDPHKLPQGTGSFMMCPWPSNMSEGVLYAAGGAYQIPVNRPPNAIHGLTRDQEWRVTSAADDTVTMTTVLGDPWPFPGKVTFDAALYGSALTMTLTVEATADDLFPVVVGWHPWFKPDLGGGRLSVRAPDQQSVWELDEAGLATGHELPVPLNVSLMENAVPGIDTFNHCFRNARNAPVTVSWPDAVTLDMTSSDEISHFVVYTPPESICVEPISCTVDAFRLEAEGVEGTGTAYAGPGAPFSAWTRWSWE